jgi:putative DNA primase/helicase
MVKPKVKDVDLKKKLKAEAPGILNWMLGGLAEILKTKCIPEGGAGAKAAMKRFSISNDRVGTFVDQCCVLDARQSIIKRILFSAFSDWCDETGVGFEKMENYFFKTLFQRFPDLQTSRRKMGDVREHCLVGIALRPDRNAEEQSEEPSPSMDSKVAAERLVARMKALREAEAGESDAP